MVAWLTVALSAGLVGAAEGQLLRNGDFESELDGSTWMVVGGVVATVATPVQAGGRALRYDGGCRWNCGVYQVAPIVAGGAYSFRGYVAKTDTPPAVVWLRLAWHFSSDGSGASFDHRDSDPILASGEGFISVVVAVTAPAGARSARASVMVETEDGVSTTIFLDSLTLTLDSPPPATATPSPSPTVTPMPSPSGTPLAAEATTTASPAATATTPSPTPTPSAAIPTTTPILAPAAATPTAIATLAPPRAGAAVAGEVLLTEAQANPAMGGGDAAWEWFELRNTASRPLTLAGWWLEDNATRDPLPEVALPPDGVVVVAATTRFGEVFPGFDGTIVYIADGRIGNGLANAGDRLILSDAAGRVSDAISWGDDDSVSRPALPAVAAGHSLARQGATFADSATPSPGHVASAAVASEATATPLATPIETATAVALAAGVAAPATDAPTTIAGMAWPSPSPMATPYPAPTVEAAPVAGPQPPWEGLGWVPLVALGAGALWFLLGTVWERWR